MEKKQEEEEKAEEQTKFKEITGKDGYSENSHESQINHIFAGIACTYKGH